MDTGKLNLLFVVEGNTDIRFVDGLARYFNLTLLVPAKAFEKSGLKERIRELSLAVTVQTISGGRFRYQISSFLWLLKNSGKYNIILAQEMLRGALNATIVGKLRRIPVVTLVGIPALEYFDCRRQRRQISWPVWQLGRTVIKLLLRINGKLATACFGMGKYHQDYVAKYSKQAMWGSYYGVNTEKFFPVGSAGERKALREKLNLPTDAFLILYASRLTHEKDPETLLRACEEVRLSGVPLVVVNLSGDFRHFQVLGQNLGLIGSGEWLMGRAAVHPMKDLADFYRAADVLVQSSLFEGVAYCTMEALACELPVIATDVGGMKAQLAPYATMIPKRDVNAMIEALKLCFQNSEALSLNRKKGREFILETWQSEKGFQQFQADLMSLVPARLKVATTTPPPLKIVEK